MCAKSIKSKGNWNRPECIFQVQRNNDGMVCAVRGAYGNGLSRCQFSLKLQTKGEYLLRGRLSMRSSKTGKVLQAAKNHQEGKCSPIAADIRVSSVTEDAIKNKIVDAFESLCAEYSDMIYQDMQEMRVDDLTLLKTLHLFGRRFLVEKQHLQEKTVKQRLRLISKAAVKLEDYHLDEIPQSALIMTRRELGPSGDDCYRYLAEFIHYLQVSHKYIGDNPIEKYYENYPRKTPKSLEQVLDTVNRPRSLSDSVTHALCDLISKAPATDCKITGMLLIYSTGINTTVACSLTWGNLVFAGIPPFQDCCQIHLSKEKTVGATHDYTHPIFRFGARELKRRYEAIKFSGDPHIDKRKILGGLTSTALTAFCRTCLQYLGVSHQVVEEAKSKKTGGGVMLLLQDYYYRLIHHCGIRSSAELKYLRMHSLGMDVTADNYRSLSSPSGQKRLQLLLNRDIRFEPENVKSTVTVTTTDDGYRTVVIPPQVSSRTTAITFRIRMKRGQKLTILSEEGLKGTVIPLGNPEREPASAPTALGSQQLKLWNEA